MSRLILIRHCASSGQWPDAALSPAGAEAAQALVERLLGLEPDAVYASPYARAVSTVAPFAERASLTVHLDARLKERVLADPEIDDWLDHIRRSFDDLDHRAPGGESLNQVRGRALAALAEIAGAGHRLPIVASHGNLISSVLGSCEPGFGFDQWQALRNPELFELTMAGGRLTGWRSLS
jgi:2,3-bisphosphoglycerate-dependent phosphoglycerate mutase